MSVRILPQHLTITGALALALCLVALLGAAGSRQAHALEEGYKPSQVIVKLNPIIGATIEEINADYGSTTLDDTLGRMDIYLLQKPPNETEETFAQRLTNDPQDRVLYAEPNFVAEAPEDPAVEDTMGVARMKARTISSTRGSFDQYAAENLNLSCEERDISQGQGVTVAVLDTGAQLNHPRLEANFKGVKTYDYDFVDNDTKPSDKQDADGDGRRDRMAGHGTHVAGIVDRVAPAAKIMPLRVLDSNGYGDVFTVAKAVSYAQRNGARVINLSLGTSKRSRSLEEIIKNAYMNGGVVVAAAGNSGTTEAHYPAAGDGITPASAEGLVAVTSVGREKKKSDFANYGSWVDIAAPGEDIRSTFPIDKYATWSGTSMATPFVSGQAALIRKAYGSLDPAAVEGRIRNNANLLLDEDPVYGSMLGRGHADVCKSLR